MLQQVENPIPFADSALTRGLSIGYLHARYAALLVAPLQLSADWSFSCIPLVTEVTDPRNIATATLYGLLIAIIMDCVPLKLKSAGAASHYTIASGQQAQYRALLLLGLVVRYIA